MMDMMDANVACLTYLVLCACTKQGVSRYFQDICNEYDGC